MALPRPGHRVRELVEQVQLLIVPTRIPVRIRLVIMWPNLILTVSISGMVLRSPYPVQILWRSMLLEMPPFFPPWTRMVLQVPVSQEFERVYLVVVLVDINGTARVGGLVPDQST